jgi:hypothetical protein
MQSNLRFLRWVSGKRTTKSSAALPALKTLQ